MPQLQINQGPQDALLYDNTRSYFTNVGYVRTSNFQVELRDIQPQNNADLGGTVQFVIPKAADLLGPLDLVTEFQTPTDGSTPFPANAYAAWVESVGYAMIEKITFSIGSNDVETIEGDHLNIINELMRSETQRQGKTIGKTGRGACAFTAVHAASASDVHMDTVDGRIIADRGSGAVNLRAGKKIIVPLGLFFTKHPSQYFPLAAIAGCNDVRVTIKFRNPKELLVFGNTDRISTPAGSIDGDAVPANAISSANLTWSSYLKPSETKLRAHYVHVTGPEATTLMNKEHVRLMKLWTTTGPTIFKVPAAAQKGTFDITLSFLHPVQEIIITIRKVSELGSEDDGKVALNAANQKAHGKNRFAYHGNGLNPNVEAAKHRCSIVPVLGGAQTAAYANGSQAAAGLTLATPAAKFDPAIAEETIKVLDFKLTLNGQERHPGLSNSAIDRDYLMDRLMPMLHSNSATNYETIAGGSMTDGAELDFHHLAQMKDRKEIYVYPFALNPEGANPSGAVNFSKVSHAKLQIGYQVETALNAETDFQVDVYGVYYNWLQIKDGRALLSFA